MTNLTFPLPRVFIGLPLEDEAKRQYQALQETLKPYEEILRFQNAQQPHFTLQFWPEVMEIEWDQIFEQSAKVAGKAEPFTVRATEPETFGKRGEDRVLFLDIAFSDELARLKKSCPWPSDPSERPNGRAGKPFAPHLTIARIRHPQKFAVKKKEILKLLKDAEFDIPIDRLRLYAEVEGVKQTPMKDFVFGGQV